MSTPTFPRTSASPRLVDTAELDETLDDTMALTSTITTTLYEVRRPGHLARLDAYLGRLLAERRCDDTDVRPWRILTGGTTVAAALLVYVLFGNTSPMAPNLGDFAATFLAMIGLVLMALGIDPVLLDDNDGI